MSRKDRLKLGATGAFPDGKSRPDDEGELRMALYAQDGLVHIHFGKPITWVAMGPNEALELAARLTAQANNLPKVQN